MQYRKKTSTIEAAQWFRHGDHSQVQNFRSSDNSGIPENPYCPVCGNLMHRHGLLDGVNGEEIVCPSDYIITNRDKLCYRLPRGEFEAQYEIYVRPPSYSKIPISDLEERVRRRKKKRE